MQLGRTSGQMHHQDIMTYRDTGIWQKNKFPGDLAEQARLAQARTSMLVSRVRDDIVRELVKKVKDYAAEGTGSATPELADRTLLLMATTNEEVNQRIGEILRKLDDES